VSIFHARSPYFSATDKQPTPDIGAIVGDLVVSGATILAHSAAEAVVKRVKKAAADTAPVAGRCEGCKKGEEVGNPR
jgi:hypothetical protein